MLHHAVFYSRMLVVIAHQHGEEKGRLIACALLEDLMEAGALKTAPSLSFLGLAVMDELCARHIAVPVVH
ncbi:hypothetical protein L369_03700 [Enterobacter sp. MGH 23]|nr:hypothetical protein L369_03700 [Enterobacter sp. MGH 23]